MSAAARPQRRRTYGVFHELHVHDLTRLQIDLRPEAERTRVPLAQHCAPIRELPEHGHIDWTSGTLPVLITEDGQNLEVLIHPDLAHRLKAEFHRRRAFLFVKTRIRHQLLQRGIGITQGDVSRRRRDEFCKVLVVGWVG